MLLKPAAGELRLALWGLKHAGEHNLALETMPEPPKAGRTSVIADPALPAAYYRATGYHLCGTRAVRTDILERLSDLIRPLIAWKPGGGGAARPKGATGDGGFVVVPEMLSILGCSAEELGGVLRSLGFHVDRRPAPKTMTDPAPMVPVVADAAPIAVEPPAVVEVTAEVSADAVAADAGEPVDAGASAESDVETAPADAPIESQVDGTADASVEVAEPIAAAAEATTAAADDGATPAETTGDPVEADAGHCGPVVGD